MARPVQQPFLAALRSRRNRVASAVLIAFMLIRLSGDPMSMYGQSSALKAEDRDRIIKQHGTIESTNRYAE